MFIILAQFGPNFPPVYQEVASVLRSRGHVVWTAKPNEDQELLVHNGTKIVARLKKPTFPSGRFFGLPGIKRLVEYSAKLAYAVRVRRFFRENRPDVIQLNRASIPFFWLIPLWTQGCTKYVLDWRQISEREFKGILREAKRFVAVQYRRIPTRYIYDQGCFLHSAGAKQVLGDQWQRWATVVPLAVSANFLNEQHNSHDTNENESQIRFIYVGILNQVRRLDRIILAAHELRLAVNDVKKFEVSFLGPDESEGIYQELIDELDLGYIVRIKPPIPYQDIPRTLAQYDVALAIIPEYPLDWQYHPTLKVLEYRALGLPIIATNVEPNREVVQDGVNGLLVHNSPDNIAQAMQRFINENGFLAQCSMNAQTMRHGLRWQDIGELYEQLYLQLLQPKKL